MISILRTNKPPLLKYIDQYVESIQSCFAFNPIEISLESLLIGLFYILCRLSHGSIMDKVPG